jgi:hypothetical protein
LQTVTFAVIHPDCELSPLMLKTIDISRSFSWI